MLDRLDSDPLSAVVSLLRPQAVMSKVILGAGLWGVIYAPHGQPGFTVVIEGTCLLKVEDDPEITLEAGDFVLLPASPRFVMAADPSGFVNPIRQLADAGDTRERRHGSPEGAPDLRMIGGYFQFDSTNADLLVQLLPRVVHIKAKEDGAERLAWLARAIGDEASSRRPGRDPILIRLAEILLIEALRWRSNSATAEIGLLAGLADAQLARALRAFHDNVSHRWTVETLARLAGMSRASFAERFSRTLGVAPLDYMTRWRMAVAKDLLRHQQKSLTEAAVAIGYQSASAFSSAFSRYVGRSPSEFVRTVSDVRSQL